MSRSASSSPAPLSLPTVTQTQPDPPDEVAAHTDQEQLVAVLESVTDAFFSMDRDFRLTYVNREAERLLKKMRTEMLGASLWSLFPEAVGSRFEREYRQVMDSGVKTRFEEYYPPLGQWYEVRAYPAATGISVFFSEVTARKQMEDALRFLAQCGGAPGEDFFQAVARYLARTLQMEYVCVDLLEPGSLKARTLALFVDEKFEDNISYTLKDTPCADAVDQSICCVAEGVRARYPKDEVLQTFGAESYVGTSLLGSDGRPIGLIAVIGREPLVNPNLATSLVRLVGLRAAGELERRLADDRLRQSEEFSRSIIESSPDCIKILDLQGRLRFMNEGGQRLLGVKEMGPFLGRLYRDFWSETDKPKVEEALATAIAGRTGTFTAMVPTLAGVSKWWHVVVSPIRGQTGLAERLLVVSRDVTAQHEAARELTWLASFPEQNPNPIVELRLEPFEVRYMNPAATRLLPGLREAGAKHPWLSGLPALIVKGNLSEAAPLSREIEMAGRCYRQEVSPVPGHDLLRVGAFDLTELKEAQRLLEEQPKRLDTLIKVCQHMLQARSVPELLDLAASAAAQVTKARMAVCGHVFGGGEFRLGVSPRNVSRPSGTGGIAALARRGGVYRELLKTRKSIRLSASELEAHPLRCGLPKGHAPLRGLLGTRLVAADNSASGVLMASNKEEGEFTAEDEALIVQVGLTASLALRHIDAKEQAERRATELDTVITSIADAVVIRDRDGRLVFANPAAARLFGLARNHPEERLRNQLHREDGKPVPSRELPGKRALGGAQLRGERFVYTSASGREYTLLASASPLKPGGKAQGTVTVWHDVTEREKLMRRLAHAHEELELAVQQRTAELQHAIQDLEREIQQRSAAERALTESEQRYRTLVESAPVGICVSTFSGQLLAANRSLCEMLRLPHGGIKGHKVVQFYANAVDPKRLRRQVRGKGNVSSWNTRLKRTDGTFFYAVLHANRIRLGSRDLLLTIIEDVTAEKLAQRHVEGIRQLLELCVTKTSRPAYLEAVAQFLREWSGCSCSGIRIADGTGRLPFAAQVGFNRHFIKEENKLKLDGNDCPCLQLLSRGVDCTKCPCGPVHDSSVSTHMASEFAGLCGTLRKHGRLACVKAGYESLAQSGIRHEGRLLGTLHLADRKSGRITSETVAFLESVAPLVGEALQRFLVEQALMESEEKFRALFEKHDAAMLLVQPGELAVMDANPAACGFFFRERRQLLSLTLPKLGIALPVKAAELHHNGRTRAIEPFEAPLESANGATRTVAVHCSAIAIRRQPLLFLIVHDVTERKLLQRRLLEIGEQERQRVGRDLHDSLGGHLTGLALLGKALSQKLAGRQSPETELATEVVQGLNQAVVQTRAIAHGLCPVEQNELGLLSSLHEYAAELRRRTGVRCELHVRGGPPKVDAMVGSHLFRITQEAVSNALAHAKARRIRISLETRGTEFTLKIWNNGAELPRGLRRTRGLGLRTMRYRADLIGASFDIDRASGGGTLVTCVLMATAGGANNVSETTRV